MDGQGTEILCNNQTIWFCESIRMAWISKMISLYPSSTLWLSVKEKGWDGTSKHFSLWTVFTRCISCQAWRKSKVLESSESCAVKWSDCGNHGLSCRRQGSINRFWDPVTHSNDSKLQWRLNMIENDRIQSAEMQRKLWCFSWLETIWNDVQLSCPSIRRWLHEIFELGHNHRQSGRCQDPRRSGLL